MSSSVRTISAISLFVEDLAAAKAFYQAIFEAPVVFEDDVAVVVKFDNVILNLLKTTQAHTLIEPGVVAGPDAGSRFQFSVWVDNVDAACAELATRGATFLTHPTNRPWGMRTATFVDPSGHSWEIAQEISTAANA